jgi:predicted metalloprotease
MRAIEGNELDRFPLVAPLVAATLPRPPTAKTADPNYLRALFDDAQTVWRQEFKEANTPYQAARVVMFSDQVRSKCGKHEGSGPFYCPADSGVYLDLRFFTELLHNRRVGAAAQAYIIGHELGHHIQRLVGIARRVDAATTTNQSQKNALSVRVELQADCLAGVWARSAFPRSGLDVSELYEGLKTAHVIGDDYLAKAAGNAVDPTLFTHGSSEQRQRWLRTGYQTGRPNACNTFASG